jgi:hypothetical protein
MRKSKSNRILDLLRHSKSSGGYEDETRKLGRRHDQIPGANAVFEMAIFAIPPQKYHWRVPQTLPHPPRLE